MPTQIELIQEAARRGILPPDKQPLYDEAVKRGLFQAQGTPTAPEPPASMVSQKRRQQSFDTAYAMPDQFAAENLLQIAGVGLGAMGDVAGHGISAVANALPAPVKKPFEATGQYLGDTDIAVAGIEGLRKLGESWEGFAQRNPRAARNIGAVGNIAAVAPVGAAGKPVLEAGEAAIKGADKLAFGKASQASGVSPEAAINIAGAGIPGTVKSAYEGTKNLGKGIVARQPDEIDISFNKLKGESSATYKQMRDAGAVIKKGRVQNIVKTVEDSLKKDGILDSDFHPETVNAIKKLRAAAKKGDVSLDTLDQYRQLFSEAASNNNAHKGRAADGLKASRAIEALDTQVSRLKQADLASGDPKAIEMLTTGRAQWSKAMKFDRVAQIIRNAEGDPKKIQQGFKNFAKKRQNFRGFTGEEIRAMKAIGDGSMGSNALKFLGGFGFGQNSRWLPASAGVAGLTVAPWMLPVVAAGTVARQGSKYIARGKAENLLRTIENRPIP